MVFKTYDEIINMVKDLPYRIPMAVAAAGDEHSLEAALHARSEGIVDPILVGDKKIILGILAKLGESVPEENIYDVPDLVQSAKKAVALVREGMANFLLKGRMDTGVLLKAVVNKEHGLGKGGVMSHFTLFEVPT